MAEALLTLIPKPDEDPKLCASYRPIALLNIDYKIYTNILANRLEKVLPDLVHPDQSGFIPQRQTHDNLHRLAHLLEKTQKKKVQLSFSPLMLRKHLIG